MSFRPIARNRVSEMVPSRMKHMSEAGSGAGSKAKYWGVRYEL